MAHTQTQQFVVCIRNEDFPASLERLKIYQALPDAEADRAGMIRVVDESGEDYVYPKSLFEPIVLSPAIGKAVLAA